MKLIKDEFEKYAQEQGYESAEELFDYWAAMSMHTEDIKNKFP